MEREDVWRLCGKESEGWEAGPGGREKAAVFLVGTELKEYVDC